MCEVPLYPESGFSETVGITTLNLVLIELVMVCRVAK